jgi:CheY-like chemotaxis protein
LARAIRAKNSDAQIIAMSGLLTDEQTTLLHSLKVTAFLNKPFTAKDLLQTLHQLIHPK